MTTRNWRVQRPQQINDVDGRPVLISVGVFQDDADQFHYAFNFSRGPASTSVILDDDQRDVMAAHLDQIRDDKARFQRERPVKGWRHVREVAGVGLTGQQTGVKVGVVDTADGTVPALQIGVCAILADPAFGAGLMSYLMDATTLAQRENGEPS